MTGWPFVIPSPPSLRTSSLTDVLVSSARPIAVDHSTARQSLVAIMLAKFKSAVVDIAALSQHSNLVLVVFMAMQLAVQLAISFNSAVAT
jgi:hypothetical protein